MWTRASILVLGAFVCVTVSAVRFLDCNFAFKRLTTGRYRDFQRVTPILDALLRTNRHKKYTEQKASAERIKKLDAWENRDPRNERALKIAKELLDHFSEDRELVAYAAESYLASGFRDAALEGRIETLQPGKLQRLRDEARKDGEERETARNLNEAHQHLARVLNRQDPSQARNHRRSNATSPSEEFLLSGSRSLAKTLAVGFDPELHLKDGKLLPDHLDFFKAGEIYWSLSRLGQTLSPKEQLLAEAYDRTVKSLRKESSRLKASNEDDAQKIAFLFHLFDVTVETKDDTLILPPLDATHLATDRARYLFSGNRVKEGGSRTRASVYDGMREFYVSLAHELKFDDSWFGGSVWEWVNSGQYRDIHRTPVSSEKIQVNPFWKFAVEIPNGKSANPEQKDFWSLGFWNGGTGYSSKGVGEKMRVRENWRQGKSGPYDKIDHIEVMIKDHRGNWVPFQFQRGKSGWELVELFDSHEPTKEKAPEKERGPMKCYSCHALKGDFKTFSPAPKMPTHIRNPNLFRQFLR